MIELKNLEFFIKVLFNFKVIVDSDCTIKQIQIKDFFIIFYIKSVIVKHIKQIPRKRPFNESNFVAKNARECIACARNTPN